MICISKNNKSLDILKTSSLISKTFKQIVFQKNMKFNLINFIKILLNTSYQASRFCDHQIQIYQDSIDTRKYKIIIFESIFACIYLKINILMIPKLYLEHTISNTKYG